ncbi:uncharacterized protein [Haliotis asinina]|uniref:uncharacterized protein n=1 Tax=Haliotis asinina TaxID=109174 RepID=UPI003531CC3B
MQEIDQHLSPEQATVEAPDVAEPATEVSAPSTEDDNPRDAVHQGLTNDQLTILFNDLCSEIQQWTDKSQEDLERVISDCGLLSKLTLAEIKVIVRFVKHHVNHQVKTSGSKAKILAVLKKELKLLGDFKLPQRTKLVPSLKTLTGNVLQSTKYPKLALNVSYANWTFPRVLAKWKQESKVDFNMNVGGSQLNDIEWFYIPEWSASRCQLEGKQIDIHHLLTRHRSAPCKGDLGHAKRSHFIHVSRNNATALKGGMMEQQLNMQFQNDFHHLGYPVPLWEAVIASVDADLFMYAISKRQTYNNRALSSQPCECLFSCLATMPGARNGVPSCVDMAKICGECIVRQDPDRGFPLRLSNAPVYPQVVLESDRAPLPTAAEPSSYIHHISVKDHLFDVPSRRSRARRCPQGISSLHEPGRGGVGVRSYHKVNECTINPLIRAGLPIGLADKQLAKC